MLLKPPTYGTVDPTGLVAISFVIFYGFILGDVGYALAIFAFGYFLKRKFGHIDIINSVGTVAYWMAASTAVFGVVFGEFFGNFGPNHLGMPVWFHRGEDVTDLMLYAIMFGAIHVPLALVLGIRADFSHHHKEHAIEKLALLLGLIGIGLMVTNLAHFGPFGAVAFRYVAVVCFVLFIGLLFYAAGWMALVLMLEVVSLVGNVLSYCRLMALGLAGVLVADLANQLGEGVGLLIGLPAALLIHTFNICLGLFSPTIHSLRLNYVEFLPKFYRPEGKSYEPFRKEALW
jgi:V/A-type H+-transporting ATPase subunit I